MKRQQGTNMIYCLFVFQYKYLQINLNKYKYEVTQHLHMCQYVHRWYKVVLRFSLKVLN